MIALCDIGQSGLKSLQKSPEAAGFMAVITSSPEEYPGAAMRCFLTAGSFASGFEALRKTRLDCTLRAAAAAGKAGAFHRHRYAACPAAAAIRTGFIRVWRCFPLTQWVQTGKQRAFFLKVTPVHSLTGRDGSIFYYRFRRLCKPV